MGTIAYRERDENFPQLHSLSKVIPDDTPVPRLHALEARYEDVRDPVVQALPQAYRQIVLARLRQLLPPSEPIEGAA